MNIEDLYKASFKGVEFFLQSAKTKGGRIIVYDKYANTDNHSLQDLGNITDTFTILGIIAGGDNYLSSRDNLLRALRESGAGILSHPFYGNLNVRLNGEFDLDESMANLGIGTISIPFIIEPRQVFPAPSIQQNSSVIAEKSAVVATQTEASFISKFAISKNLHKNFEAVKKKLEKLADKFEEAKSKAEQIAAEINTFEQGLLDFRNDITALINTPANLAAEITGLFNAINVLATDPLGQVDMFKAFFNFGGDDDKTSPTTRERIERIQNENIINELVLSQSLALAYQNAALAEYKTTDDIDAIKSILETQYLDLENKIVSPEVLDDMAEVRKQARIFFDLENLQAYRVSTDNFAVMPATILTCLLYGELDNWETLLSLNKTKDPAFIGGDYKILTR
jgi:prophage DNA circulation protein